MLQSERNQLIYKMNRVFASIGETPDTCVPQSSDNRSPIAAEYFVAAHLAALANGRMKKARACAIKASVLPDYEEHPQQPGEYPELYRDDNVQISLTVRNPATSVDSKKLCDFLLGAGVNEDTLNRAVEHASRVGRPAHLFSANLRAEDSNE